MTTHEPTTITLSITATRRQPVQEHVLQVIVSRRGVPVWALLPFRPHERLRLVTGKRRKPMASLVTVRTWKVSDMEDR